MNETRLYDAVLATPVEVQDLVAGDLAWSASRATVYGTVVPDRRRDLRPDLLAVGDPDPAVRVHRRPLLLGDRLHVHLADPEDRPVQLLLHPRDHPDVPVLGDLLPVQPASRLGRGRWPGSLPLYHLVEITRGMANGPDGLQILIHTAWLAAVTRGALPDPGPGAAGQARSVRRPLFRLAAWQNARRAWPGADSALVVRRIAAIALPSAALPARWPSTARAPRRRWARRPRPGDHRRHGPDGRRRADTARTAARPT